MGSSTLSRSSVLVRGSPVDVEEVGIGRGGTVFQNVVPPGVGVADDAHVIGHHVEDLAEMVAMQFVDPGSVIGVAADLGIEGLVVDDVVAVLRCRAGP